MAQLRSIKPQELLAFARELMGGGEGCRKLTVEVRGNGAPRVGGWGPRAGGTGQRVGGMGPRVQGAEVEREPCTGSGQKGKATAGLQVSEWAALGVKLAVITGKLGSTLPYVRGPRETACTLANTSEPIASQLHTLPTTRTTGSRPGRGGPRKGRHSAASCGVRRSSGGGSGGGHVRYGPERQRQGQCWWWRWCGAHSGHVGLEAGV